MAQMLLYEKITPLSRNDHQDLKVRADSRDFAFARGSHFAPLVGAEFQQAARDLPILFTVGEEAAGAIALLGIEPGRNLFVDANGAWAEGVYVPAFIRRYPFVLGRAGGGEAAPGDTGGDEAERLTVCFDSAWSGIGPEVDGDRLFTEAGEESDLLRRQVAFLQEYRRESERTERCVRRLQELGLLTAREIQLTTADGGSQVLRDFHVVDESRLAALDQDAIGELHAEGYLGWCHAQLISLGNLGRLQRRTGDRR